jgi:hypothetical protein
MGDTSKGVTKTLQPAKKDFKKRVLCYSISNRIDQAKKLLDKKTK